MKKLHNSVKFLLLILSTVFLVLSVMNMSSFYSVTVWRLTNSSVVPVRVEFTSASSLFNQFHNQVVRLCDCISGLLLLCASILFATGAFREFIKTEHFLVKKWNHPELLFGAISGFLAGLVQLIGYLNFEKGGQYLLTDVVFPSRIWILLFGNILLLAFWLFLNRNPMVYHTPLASGALSERMRTIYAGVIVCLCAFAVANACGYFCCVEHHRGNPIGYSSKVMFSEVAYRERLNSALWLYNGLLVVSDAATVVMLFGVVLSLIGTYKKSRYVLPYSGILGIIAFSIQILSYANSPGIENVWGNKLDLYPGIYHYAGLMLFAAIFIGGVILIRREKAKQTIQ